jgi:hypothetical protein
MVDRGRDGDKRVTVRAAAFRAAGASEDGRTPAAGDAATRERVTRSRHARRYRVGAETCSADAGCSS